LAAVQEKLAFMPDYTFRKSAEAEDVKKRPGGEKDAGLGTSVAGIIGGMMALAIAFLSGLILKKRPGRTD